MVSKIKEEGKFDAHTSFDTSDMERYMSFSDILELKKVCEKSKNFVVSSEIAKHFFAKKHIKQNYPITVKSPYNHIFINFDDPIDIKMAVPKDYNEYIGQGFTQWLKSDPSDLNKNLFVVNDKLYGIIIIADKNEFKEKKEKTIELNKTGMSPEFQAYYKDTDPETTFKVYFVTSMSKARQQSKKHTCDENHCNHTPDEIEKENEELEKFFKSGFEYTNIIFDTRKLPNFISEYGIFEGDCTKRKNKTIIEDCLSNLLNLTINLINFINSNDTVECAPMWGSMKRKAKYEKKYNNKLPPDFYMIRLKYPKAVVVGGEQGESKSAYGYQFDVKGHFRTLLHKRWTHKRGQVIWIPPFKKGKGLYIPKDYSVDSPKEVVEDYKWEDIRK
jgi:hypothetical protein